MNFTEILPLVEFQLESDISDDEAIRLIETSSGEKKCVDGGWKEEAHDEDVQILKMDDVPQDPFSAPITNYDVSGCLLYVFQSHLVCYLAGS